MFIKTNIQNDNSPKIFYFNNFMLTFIKFIFV